MSATPPKLEGTEAPSQIEFLWERFRKPVLGIAIAILGALLADSGWKYYQQKQVDQKWSTFATNLGLEKGYIDTKNAADSAAELLGTMELSALEAGLQTATAEQKPMFLLAIARRAMMAADWTRAEKALADLESGYPNHSFVRANDFPPQVLDPIEAPEDDAAAPKKPEYKPAQSGSIVSQMREQLAAAKGYAPPPHFAKPEIPADAPKVKFVLTGGRSFTIALMPQAPKHRDKFLELAKEKYWVGLRVDEIQRPSATRGFGLWYQMHLGFESTREADREKWTTTDPSKHPLDFEKSDLSHFPGAVAARPEAEGKSAAERFFIVAEDASRNDGERVVFGYVIDGLDAVKAICEEPMTAQEEELGRGKPSENITVESVEIL